MNLTPDQLLFFAKTANRAALLLLAFIIVAVLFAIPAFLDPYPLPVDEKLRLKFIDFWRFSWVHEYQTLLAGIAAIAGGSFAYLAMKAEHARQDRKQHEMAREAAAQEKKAAKAALLIAKTDFLRASMRFTSPSIEKRDCRLMGAGIVHGSLAQAHPELAEMLFANAHFVEDGLRVFRRLHVANPSNWREFATRDDLRTIRTSFATAMAMDSWLSVASKLPDIFERGQLPILPGAALAERLQAAGLTRADFDPYDALFDWGP